MENQEQSTQPQTPAQPVIPLAPVTFEPEKSFPKWPLIIMVVILIITLLTGAYFLSQKSATENPTPTKTVIKSTPTATPTPNETANWKTYVTSNYSIKFPSNWFTRPYFADIGEIRCVEFSDIANPQDIPEKISPSGHSVIQMCSYIGYNASLNDLYNNDSFIKNDNTIQTFSINNYKGLKAEDSSPLGGTETLAFLENPGSTKGFIRLINRTGDIKIFNQMVSAFKFTPTAQADDGPSWTMYTSEKGKFEIQYPPTWKQPVNKEGCDPSFFDRSLYLGPDDKSVLVCQSSYVGQMDVSSIEGDKRTDSYYNLTTGFSNIKKQDVTALNVVGQRIEGVASGQWGEGALEDGTKVVHYIFYIYGRTYVASYIGTPHDVLADFDLMVSTLKFTQ